MTAPYSPCTHTHANPYHNTHGNFLKRPIPAYARERQITPLSHKKLHPPQLYTYAKQLEQDDRAIRQRKRHKRLMLCAFRKFADAALESFERAHAWGQYVSYREYFLRADCMLDCRPYRTLESRLKSERRCAG